MTILNYGVEGVHYNLTADGLVEFTEERGNYQPWTNGVGNVTILPPTVEQGDGFWDNFKAYYGTAKEDYQKNSKMVSILTPDGVNTLISKGINPKVIYIYANQITIKNRLLKRGDNKEEAERRMKADNVDFRGAEMLANRIIYNNEGKELSDVVNEVLKWGD